MLDAGCSILKFGFSRFSMKMSIYKQAVQSAEKRPAVTAAAAYFAAGGFAAFFGRPAGGGIALASCQTAKSDLI